MARPDAPVPPSAAGSPSPVPRPRVQTLSDMVFGLALSLGALLLISQPPSVPADLYYGLMMFAFSFVILVSVWYRYAEIIGSLPVESPGLILLNLVLLFVVAIEPYLLYVTSFHGAESVGEPASVLFAVDVAAMNALLSGLMHILGREAEPLIPPGERRKMRRLRNYTLGLAVFFLVTALPVFWTWTWAPGVPSRVVLWILSLPAGWGIRLARR